MLVFLGLGWGGGGGWGGVRWEGGEWYFVYLIVVVGELFLEKFRVAFAK